MMGKFLFDGTMMETGSSMFIPSNPTKTIHFMGLIFEIVIFSGNTGKYWDYIWGSYGITGIIWDYVSDYVWDNNCWLAVDLPL